MSPPPLRIGVLGAGRNAQMSHLPACLKAADVELYAVCDSDDEALERAAETYRPVTTFADYDKMLADESVDAVIVSVARQFDMPLGLRAVQAGKHVLVDTPMAASVEDAEALVAAARQHRRTVLVGHEKRYDPGMAYAHDFAQDQIGELVGLRQWYCDSAYRHVVTDAPQPLIDRSAAAFRCGTDPEADRQRRQILVHGGQILDTARYLGGSIGSIRTRLSQRSDTYCWFLEVEFDSGCFGQLGLTVSARMDWHEGFQIYGIKGSINGRVHNPWYVNSSYVQSFSGNSGRYHQVLGTDADVFRLQIEDLASAARTGSTPRGATSVDGLATLRGMVAMSQSVKSADWVRLEDVSGGL